MKSSRKNIVLFDGDCNFCDGFINFIIKHEKRKGELYFCSLNSKNGEILKNQFSIDSTKNDTIIYISDESLMYMKSDAIFNIIKKLKSPISFLLIFKLFPSKIRDLIYDLFAKHRYKIFGVKKYCEIPTSDIRSRFL